MKYIVMECHPGYAVLMDEASKFVYAANLRYAVGQTVENPVLMKSPDSGKKLHMSVSVRRFVATAACMVLIAGGFLYYRNNFAVYSTIVLSAAGDVSIDVNSHGKVLSVRSNDPSGEALIRNYQAKGKDKTTVAGELIERAVSEGHLHAGDTVSFYIDTPEEAVYSSYESEIEQEMAGYSDLNTHIQKYDADMERQPVTQPKSTPEPETLPADAPVQPAVPQPTPLPTEKRPEPPAQDPPQELHPHPAPGQEEHPDPAKESKPAVTPPAPAAPSAPPSVTPEVRETLPHEEPPAPAEPEKPYPAEQPTAPAPVAPEPVQPAEPVNPPPAPEPAAPPEPPAVPDEPREPAAPVPPVKPENPQEKPEPDRQELPHPRAAQNADKELIH